MRCCWRRRPRPVRATGWSISAPASAPPALRWPGGCRASTWFWSKSIPALARACARQRGGELRLRARRDRAGCQPTPPAFAAAGLAPDSVDAVLMNPPFNDPARHRVSPDAARGIGACGDGDDARELGSRGAAHSQIGGRADADLARRRDCGGAGGARSAVSAAWRSCRFTGRRGQPAIRILVRAIKGGRAPTRSIPG